MYYREIFKEDYIEQYKAEQESMYCAMNELTFSVAFLRSQYECFTTGFSKNISHSIRNVEKRVFNDIFKHAILKTYRYLLDDTGKNTLTLEKFKGNIIQNLKDDDEKKIIIEQCRNDAWSLHKDEINGFKYSIYDIRNKFLAHNIISTDMSEFSISLEYLEKMYKWASERFHKLCFGPLDFYDNDGYEMQNMGDDILEEKYALIKFCEERTLFFEKACWGKVDN